MSNQTERKGKQPFKDATVEEIVVDPRVENPLYDEFPRMSGLGPAVPFPPSGPSPRIGGSCCKKGIPCKTEDAVQE